MSKSLKRLVIDTATRFVYLSLFIDQVEIDSVYQEGLNNHSVTIIPFIDDMLKKANLSLQDIDEIIVGIGPGSYTGVRIGVSIAKMIGYLNQKTVYTISSLALLASCSDYKFIVPFIDARRENAFMSLFSLENNNLIRVKEDVLDNVEHYLSTIKDDYKIIKEGKPDFSKLISSSLLEKVEDIHALVPNYLQITEAERSLKAK